MPPTRSLATGFACLLSLFASWPWVGGPVRAAAETREPTPIKDLHEYPESYHLHQIFVHGTAHDVRAFDPYKLPAGSVCYGAYSFRLEDDTGTLPIIVLGMCGVPVVKDPDVENGDVVTAQVTAHAPGKGTFFLTLDGRKMPFSDSDVPQGVALNIWTESRAPVPHGFDAGFSDSPPGP